MTHAWPLYQMGTVFGFGHFIEEKLSAVNVLFDWITSKFPVILISSQFKMVRG